jgi:hypothetical protein
MVAALLALVQVRNLATAGTPSPSDFDLDDSTFFLEIDLGCLSVRFFGMNRGFLE